MDEELVRLLLPFEIPPLALFQLDLGNMTAVFFVRDDRLWKTDSALGLHITDTFEVEGFRRRR